MILPSRMQETSALAMVSSVTLIIKMRLAIFHLLRVSVIQWAVRIISLTQKAAWTTILSLFKVRNERPGSRKGSKGAVAKIFQTEASTTTSLISISSEETLANFY